MNLEGFIAKLNSAKGADFSDEDLTDLIAPQIELFNKRPEADFAGLSPIQMDFILYYPLSEHSPVRLNPDIPDEVLDNLTFFRLTEEFLRIVMRDQPVRLTKTGALPRVILNALCDFGIPSEWHPMRPTDRLQSEYDSSFVQSLHVNTILTGTVRKTLGKLFLTRKGRQLMSSDDRINLFQLVFQTFAHKFNWGFNDGYPEAPSFQMSNGFMPYLLAKFGETGKPVTFYSDKFLKAFPYLLQEFPMPRYGTQEDDFHHCFGTRMISRFLEWFGLVDVDSRRDFGRPSMVRTNQNFNSVFQVLK